MPRLHLAQAAGPALDGSSPATTGVYAGCVWQEYQLLLEHLRVPPTMHVLTGSGMNFMIGRVSYTFGLQGAQSSGVGRSPEPPRVPDAHVVHGKRQGSPTYACMLHEQRMRLLPPSLTLPFRIHAHHTPFLHATCSFLKGCCVFRRPVRGHGHGVLVVDGCHAPGAPGTAESRDQRSHLGRRQPHARPRDRHPHGAARRPLASGQVSFKSSTLLSLSSHASSRCVLYKGDCPITCASCRSKTFDAAADGYGRGEGCVVFMLRRSADRVASCEPLAVMHGASLSMLDKYTAQPQPPELCTMVGDLVGAGGPQSRA